MSNKDKSNNGFYETIDPNLFSLMWLKGIDLEGSIEKIIRDEETKTKKKYKYKNVDGYHIFNHIPPERIKPGREDWEVEYSYNNELFRSDHFTKEHDGLHILFGGCSNTEGVGSNIENNWSYRLYQEISKQQKTSGYFNIAKGGYGWHQIFANFKVYVEKYGAPDYYFVLHPDVMRFYEWDNEKSEWSYKQKHQGDTLSKKEFQDKRLDVFPNWIVAMSIFIAYCASVGTKFIWTTWSGNENESLKNYNYFESTYFETYFGTAKNINSIRPDGNFEKDDIDFRDGHPGQIQQILWFQSFKDELIKRKEIFK